MLTKKLPTEANQLLRNPEAIRKALCERSFHAFVSEAWGVVDPEPFVDGQHIKAICDALEQCARRDIQSLVINVPPGHGKSMITAVMFPAWLWGPYNHPHERLLIGSHSIRLAERDSVTCRALIESPWYQNRWGDRFKLADDQNAKGRYKNSKGGERVVCSPGSKPTGESAEIILVDDAHDINQISEDSLQTVRDWYDLALSTRIRNPKVGVRIVVGQRVAQKDLSGHLIESGKYTHLCLPAEYIPPDSGQTRVLADSRAEEGQILWPERYTTEALSEIKVTLGSAGYSTLFQQRPIPPGGNIIKTDWLRYYDTLPDNIDTWLQSWDLTFTGSKTSDYVVGTVWARKGGTFYLVDMVRGQWDFPATLKQIRALSERYPQAITKLVEKAANGHAAIATLQGEVAGLIPITASKGKVERLNAVAPLFEAGNVCLPQHAAFLDAYRAELTGFPAASHDDMVDSTSQALMRLNTTGRNSFSSFSYI